MPFYMNLIYRRVIKPFFDRLISVLVILAFLPFGVLIALTNRFLGLPVFYIQERPGLFGQPFKIIKFCTIHPVTGAIPPFSAGLRVSSLDEIPQFINVLRGEMSIIGPRPLFMEYLAMFSERENGRHLVKPGITGLAQVSGRNELTLDQKVLLDLEYVDNISFAGDIEILGKTIVQLMKAHQADGHKRLVKSGHD